MNMKIYLCLVVALLSGQAWAGPSTGGGGFAVFCPRAPVELLDLYEGRVLLKYHLASASGDLRHDYFQAVQRTYTLQGRPEMAAQHRDRIMNNLSNFMLSTKFIETEAELPRAEDAGVLPWVPSQCVIRQVAYFDDIQQMIYILKPAWNQMDSLSQAALVEHELMSNFMRRLGERTSEAARKAVAHIFALNGSADLCDGLPEHTRRYLVCSAKTSVSNPRHYLRRLP